MFKKTSSPIALFIVGFLFGNYGILSLPLPPLILLLLCVINTAVVILLTVLQAQTDGKPLTSDSDEKKAKAVIIGHKIYITLVLILFFYGFILYRIARLFDDEFVMLIVLWSGVPMGIIPIVFLIQGIQNTSLSFWCISTYRKYARSPEIFTIFEEKLQKYGNSKPPADILRIYAQAHADFGNFEKALELGSASFPPPRIQTAYVNHVLNMLYWTLMTRPIFEAQEFCKKYKQALDLALAQKAAFACTVMGVYQRLTGDLPASAAMFDEIEESAKQGFPTNIEAAATYFAVGEHEKAEALLEQARGIAVTDYEKSRVRALENQLTAL